ncbi:MAG TPA: UPF0149 family protein [Acidobacteriota bacterium]|nr:UPF0149 family protein [Acidobacteriota bacterium]HNT18373.1 UPF0149 family protein [Acidobacteriota bacterium]
MSFEVTPILSPSQKSRLQDLLDLQKDRENGMNLAELEGFFFGLAINPWLMLMPSTWVPMILEDENIVFKTRKQAEEMVPILLEVYNSYMKAENEGALAFPFDLKKLDVDVFDDLLGWCAGLKRAVFIRLSAWRLRDIEIPQDFSVLMKSPAFSLCLIQAINDEKLLKGLFPVSDGEAERSDTESMGLAIKLLPEAVGTIQEYSRELRRKEREEGIELPPDGPAPMSEKIGRNDPCPCGSGKKYKKCCGAG